MQSIVARGKLLVSNPSTTGIHIMSLLAAIALVFLAAIASEIVSRKVLPASWASACGFVFGALSIIVALML